MKKAITILILLLLASFTANVLLWNRDGPVEIEERRETYIDTIPYYHPIPKDSVVVRYVTDRLPIKDSPIQSCELAATEEKTIDTSAVKSDSATVVIPITQKVYEDSTFRAYVSGYRPALDSIEIFKRTETVYIRSPTRNKKWGIGLQLGCGLTPNKVQPYIGIGISYNIISF